MPKISYQISDGATEGVERACEIAKQLINSARGQYDTEEQCLNAVARRAKLTPSKLRQLIQPSRRPKEVGYSVWTRLCTAYRRQLERQLHQLEDEIARLAACDPDERAVVDLLHEAEALAGQIRTVAEAFPAGERSDQLEQPIPLRTDK